MGKMLFTIDDDLERKFRIEVVKRIGGKKGDYSVAIEEAIRQWISKKE